MTNETLTLNQKRQFLRLMKGKSLDDLLWYQHVLDYTIRITELGETEDEEPNGPRDDTPNVP